MPQTGQLRIIKLSLTKVLSLKLRNLFDILGSNKSSDKRTISFDKVELRIIKLSTDLSLRLRNLLISLVQTRF